MKLTRVEIFGNVVLLDEFIERLDEQLPNQYYSIMPVMYAKGKRGKAFGDDIWLESNFNCVMFVENKTIIETLFSICKKIKDTSPKNALKIFVTEKSHVLDVKDLL